MRFTLKEQPNLPSWAPNLAGFAEATPRNLQNQFRADAGEADKDVFLEQLMNLEIEDSVLVCSGVVVGEVVEVGLTLEGRANSADWNEAVEAWRVWVFDLVIRSTASNPDSSWILTGIVRTLCYGPCRMSERHYRFVLHFLLCDLRYLCQKRRGLGG